jgi:hypothetical protein
VESRPVKYEAAEAVAPDEGAAPILKAEPVNPGESGASPEREVHIVASTASPIAEQTALSGRQTHTVVSTRESVEPPPHVAQAIGVGGEAPAAELKGNEAIEAERSAPAEALSSTQADATPQMVEGLDSAVTAGYETVVAEREQRPTRALARILGILLVLALLLSGGVLLRDRLLTSAPGKSTQTVPTRTASTNVAATGTPLPAPSGSWDFAALPNRPDQIILTLSNDTKEAAQVRVYNLGAGGKLLASLSVPASSGGELALDPGAASAPLRVLASAPIRVGRTVVRGGTTQFDYGAPGGKGVTPGKP